MKIRVDPRALEQAMKSAKASLDKFVAKGVKRAADKLYRTAVDTVIAQSAALAHRDAKNHAERLP